MDGERSQDIPGPCFGFSPDERLYKVNRALELANVGLRCVACTLVNTERVSRLSMASYDLDLIVAFPGRGRVFNDTNCRAGKDVRHAVAGCFSGAYLTNYPDGLRSTESFEVLDRQPDRRQFSHTVKVPTDEGWIYVKRVQQGPITYRIRMARSKCYECQK